MDKGFKLVLTYSLQSNLVVYLGNLSSNEKITHIFYGPNFDWIQEFIWASI